MAKSKVAKIKEEMMWTLYCPKCGNCKNFTSETVEIENTYGSHTEVKNKRCSVGGFATPSSSWCPEHSFK